MFGPSCPSVYCQTLTQNPNQYEFLNKYRDCCKKKQDLPKIMLLINNPQFFPNQADIQEILSTHELVIFTKFHNSWIEI